MRIAERIKHLSGKRKPMQIMGKLVNKKIEVIVHIDKEEKMED